MYQPLFKHCLQQEQNTCQKEVDLSPGREVSPRVRFDAGMYTHKKYNTTIAGERQRNSEMNPAEERAFFNVPDDVRGNETT